jgi:two-component system chemotaxis sensor kinase CheA
VDAVLAQARRVGGAVELRTAPGEGTQWSIRLPLTVAIVRALLVAVDGRPYAIPLTHVRETVDLVDVATWDADRMQLRGAEIPLVSARALMQVGGVPADRPQVVLLERGDRTVGVVVDGLLGQREIVVERLDAVRGARALFSGATRLPDGTLALILDAGSLR